LGFEHIEILGRGVRVLDCVDESSPFVERPVGTPVVDDGIHLLMNHALGYVP